MPIFSPDVLQTLAENCASLRARNDALAESFLSLKYNNSLGREHATHGYLRRVSIMTYCVEKIFTLIPPERDALPDDDLLIEATICIQAFVMNVFGALDNLAWIWVSEKALSIDRTQIGLAQKCKAVRASFSPQLRDYLSGLDRWFNHIVDFRDALAHRIPLYIPPYCVPDANQAAYSALNARKFAAQDADEYDRIKAEQLELVVFQPIMKHTLEDKKPAVVFHFQLLQDFGTVEEIGRKLIIELNRP
jgi:hypothetical protein